MSSKVILFAPDALITHKIEAAGVNRRASLALLFIENERRDVFDHYKASQVNDRTDGQEDECDPNG